MRVQTGSVIAFAASALAVGNAVVKNQSNNTLYVWSVGSSVGPEKAVAPGANFTEALHSDAKTGGVALKMTKIAGGLYSGAPTQVFSYSLNGTQVWYDLSAVMGEPFKGQRITVTSKNGGTIDWPAGSNPGGSQVKVTKSDDSVVFTAYA